MDPPGFKHAVKPRAGGTQAFERSCRIPVTSMSRDFYGIAQLIVVPISDIMSTKVLGFHQ
jgi:hypothetical protein